MSSPYRILYRKRQGHALAPEEIAAVVHGASAGPEDGGWNDAQLGAFLMASVIRGLDAEETRELTRGMLESGDQWRLCDEIPLLADKHSTGGVGDKVSLILAPLLAACDVPVVMLTGRSLGHTGGTADKLETLPGLQQALDREQALRQLRRCGMAMGLPTGDIAPADRRLYSLRDVTATVDSLPLITASILSKKLASGASAVVFDVKTGNGAILPRLEDGRALARLLVETSKAMGTAASALITDMSQVLGRWAGHTCEVRESLEALEGHGPADLMEIVYVLCEEVTALLGQPLPRARFETAIADGSARERFDQWAAGQGTDPTWLRAPVLPLAPEEVVLTAETTGVLASVDTHDLGLLLGDAGGGRRHPGDAIDFEIALHCPRRLGDEVRAGDELARLYLRRHDEALIERFQACFHVSEGTAAVPALVRERIA